MCSQINIFGVLLEFICLSMIHMYDKKKGGGGNYNWEFGCCQYTLPLYHFFLLIFNFLNHNFI